MVQSTVCDPLMQPSRGPSPQYGFKSPSPVIPLLSAILSNRFRCTLRVPGDNPDMSAKNFIQRVQKRLARHDLALPAAARPLLPPTAEEVRSTCLFRFVVGPFVLRRQCV
jgi:hypothetical protein